MNKTFETALSQLYACRDSEAYQSLEEWYGSNAELFLERTNVEDVLRQHVQSSGNPHLESALEKLGRSLMTRQSAEPNTFYGIDIVIEILFQAIEERASVHIDTVTMNFSPYIESVLAFEGLAELIRDTNEWIVMPHAAAYVLLRLWYDCYYNG